MDIPKANKKKRKNLFKIRPTTILEIITLNLILFFILLKVCPGSIGSNDSVNTTTALVPPETPKKKKKKKMKLKCLFPWWFVYIGWFFCLSTAIVAGFFTLLYGISFDNKQQEEWLISMFVSMAQDVLVSQPIKVIFMAVLFALLLKKPQDEDDDVINAELARDEEWLEQNLPHAQRGDAKAANTQYQRPPDKVCVAPDTSGNWALAVSALGNLGSFWVTSEL